MKECARCGTPFQGGGSLCPECRLADRLGGLPADDALSGVLGQETVFDTAPRAPVLQPGDVLADRYEVLELLGRGGMGAVYKVRDTALDRVCAVKVLEPGLAASQEAVDRFFREVRTSLELTHPHIVRVYDVYRRENVLFLSMEFLDGKTLRQWLSALRQEGRRPSLDAVCTILDQVLDALSYAHRTTVHRDVKPENIFLLGTAPGFTVKLVDFGIAKTLGAGADNVTRAGSQLGTMIYASPEQIQDPASVDARSDLYAVGVVLYELLTGVPPLGAFELPSAVRDDIGPEWDDLVRSAMNPDPARRPRSTEEMRRRLAELRDAGEKRLSGDEVPPPRATERPVEEETGPSSPPAVTSRRRRTGVLALAAILAVVAVAGLVRVSWRGGPAPAPPRQETASATPPAERATVPKARGSARPTVPETHRERREPARQTGAQPSPSRTRTAAAKSPARKNGDATVLHLAGEEFRFRWIGPGTVRMGSAGTEPGRNPEETRWTAVVSRGFWLGETEVTQAQWRAVTGENPSRFRGDDRLPVDNVSWFDARDFVRRLAALDSSRDFFLPSEAEWELAARAGRDGPFPVPCPEFRSADQRRLGCLARFAWYVGNSEGRTHPVRTREANAWRLYDVLGNVAEWCRDWYGPYPGGRRVDYDGPPRGSRKVLRGGSWSVSPARCRLSARMALNPKRRLPYYGLRIAWRPR